MPMEHRACFPSSITISGIMNAPGKGEKTTYCGVRQQADMKEMRSGDFAQIPVRIKSMLPYVMNESSMIRKLSVSKEKHQD